jgi:hypothetical protein
LTRIIDFYISYFWLFKNAGVGVVGKTMMSGAGIAGKKMLTVGAKYDVRTLMNLVRNFSSFCHYLTFDL